MASPHVRLRIDFAPNCSLGPGKVALLEAIASSGSLSAAARALKMSYRRAWLLLHDLNESFGEKAVALSVGGRAGGGAQLTPFGQRLIAAYRETEAAAQGQAARFFRTIAPVTPPKAGGGLRRLQRSVPAPAPGRRGRGSAGS